MISLLETERFAEIVMSLDEAGSGDAAPASGWGLFGVPTPSHHEDDTDGSGDEEPRPAEKRSTKAKKSIFDEDTVAQASGRVKNGRKSAKAPAPSGFGTPFGGARPPFGSSSGFGGFGGPSLGVPTQAFGTPAFGAPTPASSFAPRPAFGAQPPSFGSRPAFGASISVFGAKPSGSMGPTPPRPASGAPTPAFGATPSSSAISFGTPLSFGSTTTATTFGAPPSFGSTGLAARPAFDSTTAVPSGFGFGTSSAAPSGFVFGTTTAAPSGFGAVPAPGFSFGTPATTTSSESKPDAEPSKPAAEAAEDPAVKAEPIKSEKAASAVATEPTKIESEAESVPEPIAEEEDEDESFATMDEKLIKWLLSPVETAMIDTIFSKLSGGSDSITPSSINAATAHRQAPVETPAKEVETAASEAASAPKATKAAQPSESEMASAVISNTFMHSISEIVGDDDAAVAPAFSSPPKPKSRQLIRATSIDPNARDEVSLSFFLSQLPISHRVPS
jgi:hypothetical protein